MRRIVTVHGINSNGDWQEKIKEVLEPHFRCSSIKYEQYLHRGEIKLFSEPRLLVILILITLALWFSLKLSWVALVAALAVLLSGFTLGWHLARRRRETTLLQFKSDLDKLLDPSRSPHIIAHSLGSYLTGISLRKWDNVKFDRIIMVGCVLSKNYDWLGLLNERPGAFTQVRNEVARKDIVARAAFFLQGLVPGLGHAGYSGFNGNRRHIHTSGSPNFSCAACDDLGAVANIHNVICKELGHSECFTGLGHVADFWLPYFWGIDHVEFQQFTGMCQEAEDFISDLNYPALHGLEQKFRSREWHWAAGTVTDFARGYLHSLMDEFCFYLTPNQIERKINLSIRVIWNVVIEAKRVPTAERIHQQEIVRGLHPASAVRRAIITVLHEYLSR